MGLLVNDTREVSGDIRFVQDFQVLARLLPSVPARSEKGEKDLVPYCVRRLALGSTNEITTSYLELENEGSHARRSNWERPVVTAPTTQDSSKGCIDAGECLAREKS